jgi:hypothetical protein
VDDMTQWDWHGAVGYGLIGMDTSSSPAAPSRQVSVYRVVCCNVLSGMGLGRSREEC